MSKATRILNQSTQWSELKDIYIKVLKQGWDIQVVRVREDGTYIFKLTRWNLDWSDFQMGELGAHSHVENNIYRVLGLMEKG